MGRGAVCVMAMMAMVAVANGLVSCPSGYNLLGGSCYALHRYTHSWYQAEQVCEGEDGHLASVETTQQYTQLLDHIADVDPGQYWLSGRGTGGTWRWENGDEMNNAWWGRRRGPTSNLCAYFCSYTRKYWPASCSLSKNFVCQTSPEDDDQILVGNEVTLD